MRCEHAKPKKQNTKHQLELQLQMLRRLFGKHTYKRATKIKEGKTATLTPDDERRRERTQRKQTTSIG